MAFLRRINHAQQLGPLSVLAILLIVSGILRFLSGPAIAIANEVGDLRLDNVGTTGSAQCEVPPDVAAVLEGLAAREQRLLEREESFVQRSTSLSEAETRIGQQLTLLEEAEESLAATLAQAVNAAESDVARLTTVYENMKPKEAAVLFETMAPDFAAGFLGRMRPDAAAKVIEGLAPEVAYSISVILAGRNANSPKE